MKLKSLISFLSVIACAMTLFASTSVIRHFDVADGLSHRKVGGAVQDANGLLWFATWNGLNCYDGYEFHWVRLSPEDSVDRATNHIRDIMLSPEGNILCHTDEDIFEYDLHSYSFRDISNIRKDSLAQIMGKRWHGLTDRQWNRWSPSKDGLLKTSSPHHPASIFPATGSQSPRAIMIGDDGLIWVGTSVDKGIDIYTPDGSLVRHIPLHNPPYSIFQSADSTVWIGCKPGALLTADGVKISDDIVYDIAEDAAGNIWLATFGEGVKVIDRKNRAATPSATIGGKRVRDLLITTSQNIIAATNNGLLLGKINHRKPALTRLREIRRMPGHPEGLSSNTLMSVASDNDGNIYIATESSGIDMISEDELMADNPRFTHLTSANGALPSDNILSMAFSGDSILMIVGADNVAALDIRSLKSTNFNSSFWTDSCRFSEATPARMADGTWLIGSEQGLLKASAGSLWSRGHIPSIVFTTVSVQGGDDRFCLPGKKTLHLDARSRNATIKYAALDYTDNRHIIYRTRLDGSEWTSQGRSRSVTLFNLAPDPHILEVQSTDCYGRWVDNTSSLEIIVAPLWHETWWARSLFMLLIAAAIASCLWVAVYVRNIDRQRREFLAKYMELIAADSGKSDDSADPGPAPGNDISQNLSEYDRTFLDRVRKYVDDNIANPEANVDDMAASVAVSRSTLNRRMKSKMGISPAQLLIEARLQRAHALLASAQTFDIAELAEKCGYSDTQYFQRSFRKRFGHLPSEYKND